MANIIIVLLLAAAVGYGIYSFVHHLRCGGGCCGEHETAAKKVRVADRDRSHVVSLVDLGVEGDGEDGHGRPLR